MAPVVLLGEDPGADLILVLLKLVLVRLLPLPQGELGVAG